MAGPHWLRKVVRLQFTEVSLIYKNQDFLVSIILTLEHTMPKTRRQLQRSCISCGGTVQDDQERLICEQCNRWQHRGCQSGEFFKLCFYSILIVLFLPLLLISVFLVDSCIPLCFLYGLPIYFTVNKIFFFLHIFHSIFVYVKFRIY